MKTLTKWIALITGVTALVASVGSLTKSCQTERKTDQISAEIEELKNCRNEVVVDIGSPKKGEQVPAEVDVSGTSTVHPTCRYVFLIAQDVPPTGRRWKILDIPQLQNDGTWTGKVRLDYVSVGTEVTIVAHVTGNSRAYKPQQILSAPPDHGMPSNFVTVRRVQ